MTVHSASAAKASRNGWPLPLEVSPKMYSTRFLGVSISVAPMSLALPMTREVAPLRAHRFPLIGDPMRLTMFDDPAARYPSVGLSIPFPMSGCPHITVTRVTHVLGSKRGRGHIGDDFGRDGWGQFQQQDSIGQANGSYQGDAGEIHGSLHSYLYDINESYLYPNV